MSGHAASGLMKSFVSGETPPQSLMPQEQVGLVTVGLQVGWGLDVHIGPEQQAGDGEGAQHVERRRFRRAAHPRAGLRAEVLDDDLLHVAAALVDVADREQGVDALLRRLRRCR